MSDLLITFLASFLIWVMFAGVVVLWIIDGRVKKEQALHALLSSSIAWTAANMLKSIFPTTRPFQVNGSKALTITGSSTNGAFPSAHTALAFAIAVTLWLHDRRLGLYFTLCAIGVGLGRVLANVHFVIDIIGGAIVGITVAFLVDKLHVYKLVTRRRK